MAKDVIELLVKDHREAEELLEKIEGTTDTATRQQLAQTLVEELMRHAKAEEQVMYPAAKEALEDGAERIAEAKEEHQQVEGLLARLEKLDPGDAAFNETVTELRTAIEHHVEEEEGELFPEFEDRVERDRRTEMGRQFEEAKTKAPTSPSAAGGDDLVDLTKDELYQRAQEQDIEGRSTMTRDELEDAVRRAS